ncbi:MAG: hypothetical protein MK074_06835 [Phycisphaerales bacterium]|nr:hypothetical protein [Phycisphaerales bacterium]
MIDVQAQQTGRDYGHRDLCVLFDWQNPAQFGYCHLATEADPNSHHIQIVDQKQRTPCTTWRTEGVEWGRGNCHDLRIERTPRPARYAPSLIANSCLRAKTLGSVAVASAWGHSTTKVAFATCACHP